MTARDGSIELLDVQSRPPTRFRPHAFLLSPLLAILLVALALTFGANIALAENAPAPLAAAIVRVHERTAFSLKVPRAGQSPADRARMASSALETALDEGDDLGTHVEEHDGAAVVFVGKSPIVTLGEDDAAAEGESLQIFAAQIAARTQEAVRAEQTRSTIANTVFSFSLLVFSGVLAFLLFRRVGEFASSARGWVRSNPDRIPALRLRHIEVFRPNAVRGAITIGLGLAHLLAQLAIGYGWLLIALSLFAATRGYTEKLTGFVLTPFSALLGRVGSALPILLLASIAAVAVGVLVRFVALFFESVARGDTTLGWLPRDLAAPTSVLTRAGIIVVAIVLSAPLLTGTDDGALSRVGVATLVALGLASTPVLATVAAGLPVVFGQRLHTGDFVEIGAHVGRVKGVSLMAILLDGDDGSELRVPHLVALTRAMRVLGAAPPVTFEITVDANESQSRVRELLMAAASARVTTRVSVDLLSLDGNGARYRVTATRSDASLDLASAVADALRAENVALGRARAPLPTVRDT